MKKGEQRIKLRSKVVSIIVPTVLLTGMLMSGFNIKGDFAWAQSTYIWLIETVDSSGNVGWFTSIALDDNDNPHISYYDYTRDDLKYAYYDGLWHIDTPDSEGRVGFWTSLALDNAGNPHISYQGYSLGNEHHLKYAHYDGSWVVETVDSTTWELGFCTSIALDSSENPYISHYDGLLGILRYAYYDEGWNLDVIDEDGDVGRFSSIALDTRNHIHVGYQNKIDDANKYLKYAYYDTAWHVETIDASGGWLEWISLALDQDDIPHISYYGDGDLRYAYYDGTWHIQTVDSAGVLGAYTSLAFDSSDRPHISYYDYVNDDLKYAYHDGSWHIEVVDTSGNVGEYTSITIDQFDRPHISYFDRTQGDLKYACLVPAYYLTITASQGGTTEPVPGTYAYPANSSVEVVAIPDSFQLFDHWELDGGDVGAANPYSVLIDDDHGLHAVFESTYCLIWPTSLNFDTVASGTVAHKTFIITNTGEEILSGSVSESSDHYTIVSGGGSYSLGVGESEVVVVRFQPPSLGQFECIIETGNALCGDVYCTGVGGSSHWYWKPSYQDYAPSGMPDFDQRQAGWIKTETDQYTLCGPCAVANCFKWFDSKYSVPPGFPGDGLDMFPLVRDYLDQLTPFAGWDDHDPWNVDHVGTPWNPGIGPPPSTDQPFIPGPQPQPSTMPSWGELVERLAWYSNTDGIQTGYCGHSGTDVLEMQQGIQYWLESEMFEDSSTLEDSMCAVVIARPTFAYVESLVEKSEDVILLLGFWFIGESPLQQEFQEFIRGDFSEDGTVDAGDEVICMAGGPFSCDDAADVDDDGILNIIDCLYLHDFLWGSGPPPPFPFPSCGVDPTPDELDCASFAACGYWWRIGGHYVTVAGVNSMEQKIALSDPFIDAAELGLASGRIGDGTLIEHLRGEHDPTVHNDEGNASHDIYGVEVSDEPGGLWYLVDYPVSSDPYSWIENFFAQNVPDEFLQVTETWNEVSPIFTQVEYCIHLSPWDYRGDVNHSGAVEAGDVVYLIGYLYRGGPSPDPYLLGDVNCDGVVTAGDIVRLLNYLFRGWSVPRCCDP